MAAEETPLFAQYRKLKEEHKNEVLFFRLGDFYEMFGDDAQEVSRLLNLTLTHRGPEKMCGIPYHAAKIYIARLLRAGKKIAVAEQVGEIAKGKGLTDRKVVEIITPGTALESEYLDGGINSFLSCLCIKDGKCGFSYIDVTTGEFKATSFSEKTFAENFPKELGRIKAKELLLSKNLENNPVLLQVLPLFEGLSVSYYPDWDFNPVNCTKRLLKQLGTQSLKAFSMEELSCEATAAGFLLDYIDKTTNTVSPHIKTIKYYSDSDYLIIDDSSRRNLEITENLRDQGKQFTVLECLDFCSTAMGSRMLMERLMFPLTDRKKIESRLDHVDLFYSDRNLFHRVRNALSGILDVERLASRIAMDRAHAKDLLALAASLSLWKEVYSLVQGKLSE
ncbi:MAG: DNA mismatch repair protein MutS, partial [Treponema sp.]|nr:DNA mismatch repair protein MutS [Treponema sp.]